MPGWVAKVGSRQWQRNGSESTLSQVFPDVGHASTEGAELIYELRNLGLHFIEDTVVAGINTEFCIFLTAIDAFARGRLKIIAVADAAGSVPGPAGHSEGLARLESHLPGATQTLEQVCFCFTASNCRAKSPSARSSPSKLKPCGPRSPLRQVVGAVRNNSVSLLKKGIILPLSFALSCPYFET